MPSKIIDAINCPQCGGSMNMTTYSKGNFIGIILAIIVFISGFVVMFTLGVVGLIIGLLMIIMSLGMGGKKIKIWKCNNCGYFFERL